ncbi:MAG TPA: M28 family peptidase [Daejeonella sp.]|nr:M28 family peptidase [Daejeonella sp.]
MKKLLTLPLLFLATAIFAQDINRKQLLTDIEVLSSDVYKGRKTGTKENQMAADYIIKRFKEIGVKPYKNNFKQSFIAKNRKGEDLQGYNLVGYVKGKTDKVIVISAHYDHIGISSNYLINNGADDNASGVSALLALAGYYAKNKPTHTLIFAAFDAEEMGLQGAKAFVARPPVSLSKIRMNINMDMISHNDRSELYVAGTYYYPELKKYMHTTNPNLKLLTGHDDPKLGKDDWTDQSDQGAFHQKKIPFLYFGVEDHADYHRPSDEFQNINKEFFYNAASAILEVLNNIDQDRTIQSLLHERVIMKN